MSKLIVRRARKFDIASINKLNFEMHNYLGRLAEIKFSKQELQKEKTDAAELKKENYYVATVDNKVVGFVAFSKKLLEDEWYGKYVYLYEIAVAKHAQGKGVGKKLFQVVLDYARINKANIKVDTHIQNTKTIEFYKRLGFKLFGVNFIFDLNKRLRI